MRAICRRFLDALGYEVLEAETPEEALQMAERHQGDIDLLLTDMVMPGGPDGTDTYRRAKELYSDQKAIIVSGFAESDRVSEAQQMGAGDFIKKPLTQKSLAAAVRRELDRERSAATVS